MHAPILASEQIYGHNLTARAVVLSKWLTECSVSMRAFPPRALLLSSQQSQLSATSLPQQDENSWTAQISELIKSGQFRQALSAYVQMRELGVTPSSYTFIAALKACSKLQDLESCKRIHSHMVQTGCESTVVVANLLLDVYAKCGSLVDARDVFEKMPQRSVVSWNAMILGYAQKQQGEVALQLYARMRREGVIPNERTIVAALKACSSVAAAERRHEKGAVLDQARMIHADARKDGFEADVYVGTMLVDVYSKCGSLVDARSIFDKMPHRDVVSWNAMILAYAQIDKAEMALQLYSQMQQENISPNHRTFVGVLKACSSLAALEEWCQNDKTLVKERWLEQARAIHLHVTKSRYESDPFVANMLVDVYAKCGGLVDARRVFENMPNRNVVSWTAMILGYAQMEQGEEALQLYERMQLEGVAPNDRTFVGALKACSSMAALEEWDRSDGNLKKHSLEKVRAIHSTIVLKQYDSDVFVGTMLVDAYSKCGSMLEARDVFEKLSSCDVTTWNALITGYSQMEDGEQALELYTRMQLQGIRPNDRTFIAALCACGAVLGLEKGKEIHAQVTDCGLGSADTYVQTALIDMYGKCGSMKYAQQVFDAMTRKTVVTWTALIAGYAHQGESTLVFDLFEKMKQDGIQPNSITFLRVLTVCNHVGLVDEGQKFFEAMKRDFGIDPTPEHCNCIVDLLGRSGQVGKAMEMVKTMPGQPPGALWRCVLAACQKWEEVELGREAFENALRIDRNDSAAYVMMSNIYAAADMPENAEEMQAIRKCILVRKRQGQSWWTDEGGVVHAFAVQDRSHPDISQLLVRLEDLFVKMSENGCLSQFSFAWPDNSEDCQTTHNDLAALAMNQ